MDTIPKDIFLHILYFLNIDADDFKCFRLVSKFWRDVVTRHCFGLYSDIFSTYGLDGSRSTLLQLKERIIEDEVLLALETSFHIDIFLNHGVNFHPIGYIAHKACSWSSIFFIPENENEDNLIRLKSDRELFTIIFNTTSGLECKGYYDCLVKFLKTTPNIHNIILSHYQIACKRYVTRGVFERLDDIYWLCLFFDAKYNKKI